MRRDARRFALPMGLAVAAAWVLLLIHLIHSRPAPGAADPQRLATAYQTAVTGKDEAAVERLLAQPPGGAARTLIERGGCGALTSVRPVAEADGRFLELAGAGGRRCGRLPIAEHEGRWYIDPWAAPLR